MKFQSKLNRLFMQVDKLLLKFIHGSNKPVTGKKTILRKKDKVGDSSNHYKDTMQG